MRQMTIGEHRLEYQLWPGRVRSPTLVLLHEGLGCTEQWHDLPEMLCARFGLSVMAYSRAGYGGASKITLPRASSFMHDEARDVLPLVLDAACIDDAVLIGHRDGGTIALIACSTPARAKIRAVVTISAHSFMEDVCLNGIRKAGQAFREGDLRERLHRYHGECTECAFFGWHDTWARPEFSDWHIRDLLPAVAVPTLALQGEHDEYGSPGQVATIATGVTGPVMAHVVPGCGHSMHRELTEEFLDILDLFFARHGIVTPPTTGSDDAADT